MRDDRDKRLGQAADGFLPAEGPAVAKRSRVAMTICGTLVVVALINFGFLWYLRQTPHNLGYWVVHHKWKTLEELDGPVDWLIIGDSSGLCGVDTDTLEALLGGRALNLCTTGDCTALDGAWMLGCYVERFGPPRGIIAIHVYDIWHRSMRLPTLTPLPEWATAYADPPPECLAGLRNRFRLFQYRYVPLESQNRTLSQILQFRGTNASAEATPLRRTAGGSIFLTKADAEFVRSDYSQHRSFLRSHRAFKMSADNEKALQRIAELSSKWRLPVYLFNSPLYRELWEDETLQAYFVQMSRTIAELTADCPHIRCLVERPMTFPIEDMQCVDHIIARVAADHTRALVRRIRQAELPRNPALAGRGE